MNNKFIWIIAALVIVGSGLYIYKSRFKPQKIFIPTDSPIVTMLDKVPNIPEPKIENKKTSEKLKDIYSYKEGLEVGRALNRNVFVLFWADYCGWCKKLDNETLHNSEIKELMKNYIIVHVDVEKEIDIKKKHQITALPTYIIIDPNGRVVKNNKGYRNVADFKKWLAAPAIIED